MAKVTPKTVSCPICNKSRKPSEVIAGYLVREPIVKLITKEHSAWTTNDVICLDDLNHYRAEFVEDVLEEDKGELTALEQDVLKSLNDEELLSKDINKEFDRKLTLGERTADKIASFGGSWKFIIIFGSILAVWIVLNTVLLIRKPFDPYPFILINLALSCLAAIQAPIIMMSQNRQEAKDRLRAEHDYRINLKAELEIRNLHEKLDHLLTTQWRRLLEIQEIQTQLMEELTAKRAIKKKR